MIGRLLAQVRANPLPTRAIAAVGIVGLGLHLVSRCLTDLTDEIEDKQMQLALYRGQLDIHARTTYPAPEDLNPLRAGADAAPPDPA